MKKASSILFGIGFILIGIILGLNALGITNINIFFRGWWTLFIIIPSIIGLFRKKEKTGNIIGLVIGILLLLSCRGIITVKLIMNLIIPIVLISIGLSFIFRETIYNKVNKKIDELNKEKNSKDSECYNAIFSGQEVKIENKQFNGCEINAIFGGAEINLKEALINTDIVMNCSAIFGGIDIIVPENINVIVKSNSLFGGVSNKVKTKEGIKTVYINATCMFGGVEIK